MEKVSTTNLLCIWQIEEMWGKLCFVYKRRVWRCQAVTVHLASHPLQSGNSLLAVLHACLLSKCGYFQLITWPLHKRHATAYENMLLTTPQAVIWSVSKIHTISCSCISIAGWGSSVECTWDKTFFSVTYTSHCIHVDKHLALVCGIQISRTGRRELTKGEALQHITGMGFSAFLSCKISAQSLDCPVTAPSLS